MPSKKKSTKVKSQVNRSNPKARKVSLSSYNASFFGLLILLAGFSIYSIASFFNSTNNYLDRVHTSVVDGSEGISAPPECSTCPPFPICDSVCVGSTVEVYEIFTDVMSDHKYAKAIEALYYAGIVNGYEDGSFKPDRSVNRAELLTIVTTAVDADFGGGIYKNCFTDVTDQWFAPFVCYAKSNGWVGGYADGSYKSDQTVIKSEALKIVLEGLDFEIPDSVDSVSFVDVGVTAWFAPYASVAAKNDIISGSVFEFDHKMNRAEFVDMVYKAMLVKDLL